MLDSIKQASKNIGREINRAWENLSEGWRELLSHSSHPHHPSHQCNPDHHVSLHLHPAR